MLEVLEPQSIVEIGSESGKTTRLLLELAQAQGGKVHAVDPEPGFDPAAVQRHFGECFVFYGAPSLRALEEIQRFDVVLIDGDHNWYTVFNELRLIERRCDKLGQGLPLIFLHDVGWPYGRRDLYYDPETIPKPFRQPWERRGISPSEAALLPEGGLNAHLCNAAREGGPRNGVLTAVEDYLAGSRAEFLFAKIPAVFGLGILLPLSLAEAKPELRALLEPWRSAQVEGFVDRLEMARIAMMTAEGD